MDGFWQSIDHMEIWSLKLDKTKPFSKLWFVNITVLMYQMDANKMHREKACWEFHKKYKCCFEGIAIM